MCFFNAAHNEFITQIPERIPHETGPANPDAAVPPILIKAYPTRNMRHGRDKQQVQNSWEEKCYAAGAVFTKTQVPKEVHTVPLLRSTSGQVRFDQRREMTIQQKNIYCINLASDDRRSGTRSSSAGYRHILHSRQNLNLLLEIPILPESLDTLLVFVLSQRECTG